MAFERDFVDRFKEEGRNALITYHKGLRDAHLKMIQVVNGLATTQRPGDERYTAHFTLLAQREEHNNMCLIAPPDRADHEVLGVSPAIAATIYRGYAAYNAYRCDHIREKADPKLVAHLDKVTIYLEGLAQAASEATGKVQIPVGLINQTYDAVLSEVEPSRYERETMHPGASLH